MPIEVSVPHLARESRSRPIWSVPRMLSQLPPSIQTGGRMRASMLTALGSCGARTGANNPPPMMITSSPSERLRRSIFGSVNLRMEDADAVISSLQPHAGSGDGVEEVYDEGDQYDDRCVGEDAELQDRVVAVEHAIDQDPTHARQGEDRFHEDRAIDQTGYFQPEDRQQRYHGIAQDVPDRQATLRQALGHRGHHMRLGD